MPISLAFVISGKLKGAGRNRPNLHYVYTFDVRTFENDLECIQALCRNPNTNRNIELNTELQFHQMRYLYKRYSKAARINCARKLDSFITNVIQIILLIIVTLLLTFILIQKACQL